jgi:hypothetical protein
MNKLILEMQVSLDSYLADEDCADWMIRNWWPKWTWDEGLQQYHTQLTQSANHILLSSQVAQERIYSALEAGDFTAM